MTTKRSPRDPTLFDELLWSESADSGDVTPSLNSAVDAAAEGGEPTQLTFWTLLADGVDPLDRLIAAGDYLIKDARRHGEVGLIRAEDSSGAFYISVWPTSEEGVFNLVGTAPVTDDRWHRLETWVRRAAPRLVPILLNDAELVEICAALSEYGRVEVSRLTARVRGDDSSYSRGWHADDARRRPSYVDALEETKGMMVRTLTLQVKECLSLHLRRDGGATYYGGKFEAFQSAVVARLVMAAGERRRLLSDRQRTASEPVETAIAVKVPDGTFDDPDAVETVIEAAAQRATGVAVLHRNPYLHMAVTDYLDGSNFDAFITRSDEIAIHPGYRASVGALSRLTERLGQAIAGLEIAETSAEDRPTRDELLTTG
ncbi:MAG: hypothetical protein WBW04_09195 [Nitrolancea sp.]